MDVLLVDDEVGIREGMAAFLRLRGHRVRTAESTTGALELLASEAFDAVVTDWRLVDRDAAPIVEASPRPCFVISGHAEEVASAVDDVAVLSKPVMPHQLVELLEREVPAQEEDVTSLPNDASWRVDAVRDACGSVEILDDGEFVTVTAPVADDSVLERLEVIGGDLRVLTRNGDAPRLELRFFRDGRPDDVACTHRRGDAWPDTGPVAVELHDDECSPREFEELVDRVAELRRDGRDIWLLNVPEPLRLHVEALGRSAELPKRPMVGPRLPEVLTRLWSEQ